MGHVIIGAGAAGITAAKTIRRLQPEDEIVILSEDRQISSRCLLHQYISGDRDERGLRFVPEGFIEVNRIDWRAGVSVTAVDTEAKLVYCGDDAVGYDKLLVATGAQSIALPVGALKTAPNVYGLRHFSDAQAIRETAGRAKRAVIIGAGLVGLDAAYAL